MKMKNRRVIVVTDIPGITAINKKIYN